MLENGYEAMITRDLSFIECGLKTLLNFEVDPEVVSLTFHGNKIGKICNLERYTCLRHLDLSSNQISIIEGLNNLMSLRTLNLSNNRIKSVPSLINSQCAKLDLSFNSVTDVSGVTSLINLQILLLQGNQLRDLDHVTNSCCAVVKLRHLVLQDEFASNPMCSKRPNYATVIWDSLPQLTSLDFMDKYNLQVEIDDFAPPGVEDFLEFLTSENYPTSDDSTARKLTAEARPRILQNVSNYQNVQHQILQSQLRPEVQDTNVSRDQERIDNLERQIASLLEQQAETRSELKSKGKLPPKTTAKTVSSSSEAGFDSVSNPDFSTNVSHKRASTGINKKPGVLISGSNKTDQQTVSSLMKELESEKSKRWKAEENVTGLKTNLVNLKSQLSESKLRETALNATITELKEAIAEEQSKIEDLRKTLEHEKSNNGNRQELLENFQKEKAEFRKEIEIKSSKITELENSLVTAGAKDAKREQEASRQLKTLAKEFEKLQDFSKTQINKNKALEAELEDKQTLLKSRYSIDSPEVQEIVAAKVKEFETLKAKELECLNQKLKESYDQYHELEDEFRMALYSEEARFNEVSQKLAESETHLKDSKTACETFKQKHEKSSKLVQELTNVVKEQKGRLTELQKSKQEFQNELKLKSKTYDEQIEGFREKIKELELMKSDKTKLAAHIQAQDSIIEGLRKERKLWEEELAKQGMSLAADRGRMEVRIESLEKELLAERKSMESERDSLKIKTKVIEDQTDTIKKLKEAIIERDNTIVKTRDEALKERKDLESQLNEETKLRQDLQDEISLNTERKHALKDDIEALRSDLEEKTFAYEELMKKWKQKSALIGQLEVQVKEKKSEWDKRESELISERDQAISAAKSAVNKLTETESRLEIELNETKVKFESERMELVSSCDQRIEEVEAEMREMLREHEKYRKGMDAKFNKLHSAISDFQNNSTL
ncbi:leucine-rich repeat and coiled-coil domain-containing protein 1-like [Convolutriloba macropyga]|uniref:leucine-rich repeat and coiled-coil domain-containing protein 1-like n=1 Tax=Convolutriloba macropyga TaxID=536237 RepID=UPI003F51AD5A